MTDNIESTSSKVETKTWAATWATFVAGTAVLGALQNLDLSGLPDWIEAPMGGVLTAVITFIASYLVAHKPGKLSLSALRAARRS